MAATIRLRRCVIRESAHGGGRGGYRRRVRRLLVLCLVLGGLCGCTAETTGTPAPVPASGAPPTSASGPPPTSESAAPAIELPPRPREIRLDDLDPCTLLTVEQRAELELDREPLLNVGPSGLYGGETQLCSIRRLDRPSYAMAVQLSVTAGVEVFLRPDVPAEVASIDVRGFPALLVKSTRLRDFCTVAIDVAPGQLVDVQVANGGATPVAPQDRLCDRAQQAADLAMTTLSQLR